MIDDALLAGHRLIGMIQPDSAHPGPAEKPNLFKVGCVGRITQIAETGDGRYLIQLTGIARFRIDEELAVTTPYRQCRVVYAPFADDFVARKGEEAVDRERLLPLPKPSGQRSQGRLGGHRERPNEALVNALAMMSPYGTAEKQALLEAPDLKTRAEILVAMTEIELAKKTTGGDAAAVETPVSRTSERQRAKIRDPGRHDQKIALRDSCASRSRSARRRRPLHSPGTRARRSFTALQ